MKTYLAKRFSLEVRAAEKHQKRILSVTLFGIHLEHEVSVAALKILHRKLGELLDSVA